MIIKKVKCRQLSRKTNNPIFILKGEKATQVRWL